ncbi:MAG: sugar phosphate isomerase/epimerase [Pirellulales bacterium]|nr:sugar phosphate isomerase/epimerase [Pirellulales bacterium]
MQKNFSTKELGFTAPQNEQIEMAMTYEFTSIDLDINEFGRQVQSRGMETARRLIDSAKISAKVGEAEFGIGTFRLPFAINEDDGLYQSDMKRLPGLARAAQEIGALRCVVKVEPFSDTLSMQENFELHRSRLAEIAAALGECEIKLGVEFVAPASARQDKKFEFIHTFDELTSLVDGIANVGVVIDAWHLYVTGTGPEVLQKVAVDNIVCVRLADAPADIAAADLTLQDRMLPAESNSVDCAAFVKQLDTMGYQGPVTPMCDGNNFRGERRDLVAEKAGLRMKKVWIAAGLAPPELESLYAVPAQTADDAAQDAEGDAAPDASAEENVSAEASQTEAASA